MCHFICISHLWVRPALPEHHVAAPACSQRPEHLAPLAPGKGHHNVVQVLAQLRPLRLVLEEADHIRGAGVLPCSPVEVRDDDQVSGLSEQVRSLSERGNYKLNRNPDKIDGLPRSSGIEAKDVVIPDDALWT